MSTCTFYMRGGHKIVVPNVKSVKMTHLPTGFFEGYDIAFEPGHHPVVFSMSVPDIIAVYSDDNVPVLNNIVPAAIAAAV